MADVSKHIEAEPREAFGKGAARKLRAAGKIPAVIYGHGTQPRHVSLPGHQVSLLVRKANQVLELVVAGQQELALVKDVQKDPVRQVIEHIDLVVVRRGEKVTVDVPVHLEGEAAAGTQVNQDTMSLTIEAEATNIPESLTVSIEGLEAGSHVLARDVALPAGTSLVTDPEHLVANIVGEVALDVEPEGGAEGEAVEEGESSEAEAGEAEAAEGE